MSVQPMDLIQGLISFFKSAWLCTCGNSFNTMIDNVIKSKQPTTSNSMNLLGNNNL